MIIVHKMMILFLMVKSADANMADESINASMAIETRGCNLIPSKALLGKLEPENNPLLIHVTMHVLHIRNVPDGGGSFGVDIKYVCFLCIARLPPSVIISICLSAYLLLRMYLDWEDKRYIDGNEDRATDCTSNHVMWEEEARQFWVPRLDVNDAIKLE